MFVSPSTVHLEYVKSHIRTDVIVGAQNVFHKKVGAHCVQWCSTWLCGARILALTVTRAFSKETVSSRLVWKRLGIMGV